MSTVKTLFSQSFVYGLSTIIPRLLNYLLVFLYTRTFNPNEYGIVSELYAYLAFLLILLTFGLETGFFRFINKNNDKNVVYSTSFYFLLFTSAATLIFFVLAAKPIVHLLGSNYFRSYIIILGAVISVDAFSAICFAKLRSDNRPITFSSIKLIGVFINILFNFLFIYKYDYIKTLPIPGSLDLISYVFLANLIGSSVTLVLVLIKAGIPKLVFDLKIIKELLIYSLPILIAGLGGTTNESFDRIFIKYLIPEEDNPLYKVGIYSSNAKLAIFLLLFIQMYRFAAEPFFFSQKKGEESNILFGKAIKTFIIVSLLLFLLITTNIPILKFFVGASFREDLLIVPILLLSNILYGIFFNFSFWYKLSDKTIYGIKYTFIGATITILSNIILIPLIGIYGAAVARLFCYSFMTYLSYKDGMSRNLIFIEKKNLLKYIIVCFFIFSTVIVIYLQNEYLSLFLGNTLTLIFLLFILKTENLTISKILKSES